jgi:hypothetical protein
MCLTAPELWPAQARQWYALYDKFFWQERMTAVGYREFTRDVRHSNWMMLDVDAGPVIAGYGVAASAFGVGAARKNGRFDRAYPLAGELLATVVQLPNGVLALPRLLSNLSDAPMLGEAAILWQLSVQPEKGFPVKPGGSLPAYVYIVLAAMFRLGVWLIMTALWRFHEAGRPPEPDVRAPKIQAAVWICLILGAGVALWRGHGLTATLVIILASILPMVKKKKAPRGVEDWPGETPAAGSKTGGSESPGA